MKKSLLLIIGCSLFVATNLNAQTNATSVYKKNHIKNRKPIPMPHIREADVMWAKLVWRIIDVREKMNQPIYYPTTPQDDRYSLIDLLIYGIECEGITAYDTNDDEFKEPLTLEQIRSKFDAESDTIEQRNRLTGELETKVIANEIHTDEVKRYMIKEQWVFDKQSSTMQVRIIGICPIREYVKGNDIDETIQQKQLFWIYFPEVRPLLATHEVFNEFNDATRFSFDELFIKRRFSSFITQISNVHNNRSITEYTKGLNTMLEAERIKSFIFNYEHDLWEY